MSGCVTYADHMCPIFFKKTEANYGALDASANSHQSLVEAMIIWWRTFSLIMLQHCIAYTASSDVDSDVRTYSTTEIVTCAHSAFNMIQRLNTADPYEV